MDKYKLALVSHLSVASAIGTKLTPGYAAERINLFADAMNKHLGADEMIDSIAVSLIVERFAKGFTPGMVLDPDTVVQESVLRAVELAVLVGLADAPEAEEVTEESESAEASGDVEQSDQQSSDDSQPSTSEQPQPEVQSGPVDLSKISVDSLPIHGTAKKAFKNAGLLTAADLDLFAQSRSLDDVNGVGAEWAQDTLDAIAKLKG